MSKLVWDPSGERRYESGIEQVALYLAVSGTYPKGVAWNGVTALNLKPSGAESTPLYANNRKYLTLQSAEQLGFTIEAYTYPVEWEECDGSKEVVPGVYIGQQARSPFGLVGKTIVGNDTEFNKFGHKLHLIYGGLAAPSEETNATINENIEAKTMSWECSTTPVPVSGFDSTSYICIDSTMVDAEKLKALEAILYGSEESEPRLPLPDEVFTILGYTPAAD